ncbi:MAG: nucleotidyltransferase domain-containing protein [Burkholderiaceae bacterium]|jgi:hypothetical protein|nr:nucleotidyltransferase domain-containing protein [Burkholderiaceae bacterium]
MLYIPLSLAAQTAYAQLHEAVQSREIARSASDAPGSFNRKTVSGHDYWYYQFRDLDGKLRQAYLGPDSPRLAALVTARQRADRGSDTHIKALAHSASTLGAQPVMAPHLVVIRRLADAGFFRAGGVLVGTHAFLCAGNMLGVRWGEGARTQDLDFAHAGRHLQVALTAEASLDLGDVIDSLNMGFVPAASLSGVRGGRWVHPKEPGFVLDFLTPMGRGETELVHVKAFNAQFQAQRFMEFSLQQIESAALFTRTQACLVNVPHPARMAVHKLIVSGLRRAAERTKASKDVQQAAMLYRWYQDHAPHEWQQAEDDARSRSPKWRAQLDAGLLQMTRWLGQG